MDATTAKQAYDLVGGRLVHLKLFVAPHRAGLAGMPSFLEIDYLLTGFTEVKRKLLRDAREDVLRAQLMPSSCYHESGAQIINALLKGQRLTEEDYYQRLGFDIGRDLLQKNVFALHVDSGEITFQSRLTEKYCEYSRKLWQMRRKLDATLNIKMAGIIQPKPQFYRCALVLDLQMPLE